MWEVSRYGSSDNQDKEFIRCLALLSQMNEMIVLCCTLLMMTHFSLFSLLSDMSLFYGDAAGFFGLNLIMFFLLPPA